MFVSIGSNCTPRLQKNKKLNYNGETHLFDWLITGNTDIIGTNFYYEKTLTKNYTIKNIINILSTNKYNINDFYFDNKYENDRKQEEHCPLINKNFISLHDLKWNQSNIKDVVDLFNRRLIRFKNLIKNEKKIRFIRIEYNYYDLNDYYEFINFIKKINPNLKFEIRIISKMNHNPPINKYSDIIYIYLYKHNKSNLPLDFCNSDIDWDKIFKIYFEM